MTIIPAMSTPHLKGSSHNRWVENSYLVLDYTFVYLEKTL